ncbi:MAG TPA: hypothetical protein VGP07_02775 [Polyangia bacterium]
MAVAVFVLMTGCGTAVKRDLSGIPAGQVGFDDLCGVQDYYDEIAVDKVAAPTMVDGAEIERVAGASTLRGGRARFAFETPFQLMTVRRVLTENWKRLPPALASAHRIEINVNWSERSGLHRVANNSDPELVVDGVATPLPYHICLSELLFGEPLYRQRRDMLGLPPRPTAHSLALPPGADAGAPASLSPTAASTVDAAAPTPSP